jgi:enoyl-CoA hydratase/carnithine racemase
VSIDRAATGNAMDRTSARELPHALGAADHNAVARTVVITGHHRTPAPPPLPR